MVEATELPELATGGPLFAAEAALAARLLLAFPATKFTHDVVPAKLTRTAWDRLTKRTPFVGRGFIGWEAPPNAGGRVFRGRCSWMVFLATNNPVSGSMLRGDARGIGQLGVAQVATAVLNGWSVQGLGTWFVSGPQNLWSDEWGDADTALIGVPVWIDLELDAPAAVAALPDFLRLGMDWTLPLLAEPVLNVRD